jgi:hypothetical protein
VIKEDKAASVEEEEPAHLVEARGRLGGQCGYSPFAPTTNPRVASTSPPPFRNDAAHNRRAGGCWDAFGTNPLGHQIFAMRQDGTGLRQLTATRGFVEEAGGGVFDEQGS